MKPWRPLILLLAAAAVTACTGTQTGGVTAQAQGEHQFRLSCAGCHGNDARGNGPVAPFLNVAVPDLTRIAARRGGQFPADEIYRIVDGQADLAAHGPRHMPVWGYEFFGDEPDDEAAHAEASDRIDRVVSYLHSLQRGE